MNLSKNLTLDEAIKSATALRKGIDNTPTPAIIETMKLTAEKVFQPLRDKVGPINVSSFYRCPALNKAIGGSTSSQHMKGEAIDMSAVNVSNAELFEEALKLEQFDQLIWEFGTDNNPDWVHVSYESTGKQRKQILKAIRSGGKTSYLPFK